MAKEKKLEEKVTKKIANDNSFRAPNEIDSSYRRDNNNTNSENDQSVSFENSSALTLTKKKQQYLEQGIIDRSGAYDYAADPSTYKKARK